MKISVSLDDNLLARIDEYSRSNFLTRSGFLSMAASQVLNAAELSKSITNMSIAMKKISDTGLIDDEQLQQLEQFEQLSQLVIKNQ